MEPILEPDGVDLVISSGRWSAEVLAEVAEFFQQCENEVTTLISGEENPKERKSTAAVDIIRPVMLYRGRDARAEDCRSSHASTHRETH